MSMLLPARGEEARRPSTAASRVRRNGWRRLGRLVLWVGLVFVLTYHGLPRLLPIPAPLRRPAEPSMDVTDRSGRPLRRLLANGQRTERLTFAQVPRSLVDATVSAEDKRFWSHGGIDGFGVVRASLDSLFAGRPVSGASTITQQLVKVGNGRYLNRTWKDKLREMAFARKLETTWSKEKILTEYLQRVNYGNQTTGCAAAAALYFKKPLGDLSLAECAFLAGLPQAPTRLNPYKNFDGAKKRQEWILSRMREDGRLTDAEAKRATDEPLRLRRWTGGFAAPHFVEMLLAAGSSSDLPDTGITHPHEPDEGSREGTLRTTLDLEIQEACEQIVRQRLLTSRRSAAAPEVAVVVIDNATNGVRALVGSPDFFKEEAGQVNGAIAPRSAGSTLKPFTYLLALQNGDSPATIVDDLPMEFMTPTGLYAPKNYDRRSYGPMRYREALANSLNLSAVRVLERIGGPEVLATALRSLGLTTLSRPADHYGLGLTIGNAEVRLLELANAYACLARLGQWRPVVLHAAQEDQRADEADAAGATATATRFDPEACWLIADMLSDPQARARCFGLESPLRLPFPAAVKTGTSTDFRDNWCLGFTPEFTVGVWMGHFDHRPMDRVSGVTGAAPIWREVMLWLAARHKLSWYAQPSGIVEVSIDPLTGERTEADQLPAGRRLMTEKCARHALPGQAPVDRYDAMGRVRLPGDYARWLRSRDNWLGEQSAVAVSGLTRDSSMAIRITSPVAGSTLILDPDLPEGGRRLPLRASSPLDAPQWTSTTLEIENEGPMWAAQLVPGRHEIRLRDGRTGAEARAVITVRSL